jgi:hypothetical protein
MKLVITIDTEEDNWIQYSATENPVENLDRIFDLQMLFDAFGVKPTYLISYPAATNPRSVAILRQILEGGNCEIGAHCHPWNTPPFEEEINEHHSMLCNLPEELQYRKLENLHEAIYRNFKVVPVSFRAGRWGFGTDVARSLCRLGYRVDTSLTPYENWAVYQGPDFSGYDPQPFRFDSEGLSARRKERGLLEVPATIGFLQGDFSFCQRLKRIIEVGIFKNFHLLGILGRLRLLNKVWLSPEFADADLMIRLARRMMEKRFTCLNMSFHSTSLMAGLSPFVRSKEEETGFLRRIESFLIFAVDAGLKPMTLAEFEVAFNPKELEVQKQKSNEMLWIQR